MMKHGAVYAAVVTAMLLTGCEKKAEAGGDDLRSAFGGVPDNTETASVPDCQPGAMSLTYVSDGKFAFVNNGKVACSIQGYPSVTPLDASKAAMGLVKMQRDSNSKPVPVTVQPGGKAEFQLASDQSYGTCSAAAGVKAKAPGSSVEMTAMGSTKICGNYAYLTAVQAPKG